MARHRAMLNLLRKLFASVLGMKQALYTHIEDGDGDALHDASEQDDSVTGRRHALVHEGVDLGPLVAQALDLFGLVTNVIAHPRNFTFDRAAAQRIAAQAAEDEKMTAEQQHQLEAEAALKARQSIRQQVEG